MTRKKDGQPPKPPGKPAAKLTPAQVIAIRAEYGRACPTCGRPHGIKTLAWRHGRGQTTILQVVQRRTWRDL